jgi:hypothetical protein
MARFPLLVAAFVSVFASFGATDTSARDVGVQSRPERVQKKARLQPARIVPISAPASVPRAAAAPAFARDPAGGTAGADGGGGGGGY